MTYKDYYAVLGLTKDADLDAIKRAYRKLARQHHPDMSKAPQAEAKFKDVAEAYATLKNPQTRAAYDELGQQRAGEAFAPPPDWQRSHMRSGQRTGDDHVFSEMDLAELMAAMGRSEFNANHQGQQRTARSVRGRDWQSTVRISLEDAHRGAKLNLDVSAEGGATTLEVTIPAGVKEGQKLRLRGRGGEGRPGSDGEGERGDIYLHITFLPHPLFRADHHDLYFDLALTPWEAALGADIEVETLDGKVLLAVPAGTRAGRKLRMRGHGLAVDPVGNSPRGDVFAVVHIDVPTTLNPREQELFRQLADISTFNPRRTLHPTPEPHNKERKK
jgi:curved DNA-binding protein